MLKKSADDPWPIARWGHAACCINFGNEAPHLLVAGGVDNDNNTLGDAWLLNVDGKSWKEVGIGHQYKYLWLWTVPRMHSPVGIVVIYACKRQVQ